MKFGSLFTGIGGFDLGFEQAGLECAWQVEINKDCQKVLQRRFPNVERFEDITRTANLSRVAIICGGFPCQDLSVAGKRAGLAGERSGLWFEFLRIIREQLPQFVVIENVPGLLSSNGGRDFAIVIQGLALSGYGVAWRVLDAQYFGLAQRRKRVFIVGSLGNGSCAQILFEPESGRRDTPPSREARASVTGRTGKGAETNGIPEVSFPIKAGEKHDESHQTYIPDTAWALQERDGKGADSSTKDGYLIVANCFNGYSGGADDIDAQANHLVSAFRTTGNSGCYETGDKTGALTNSTDPNAQVVAFHENKSGLLSKADVLGLRSGASHSYQGIGTSIGVRRLTPTECERLQGFPDGWTGVDAEGKTISDSARYRMLGNAVAVPVAEWIGKRIADIAGY